MPLTQTELELVEAMYKNKCDIKLVQQALPHAVQSTLYRMRRNYELYGSLQKPETTEKMAKRKTPPESVEPKRPPPALSDADRDTVQALFEQGCTVNTVMTWFPKARKSTLYRMKKNYEGFKQVRRPESDKKRRGRPSCVTPEMKAWVTNLRKSNQDIWHKNLAQELFEKFQVTVSRSTISRMLNEQPSKAIEVADGPYVEPLDPYLR